jgi:hypothetical protein
MHTTHVDGFVSRMNGDLETKERMNCWSKMDVNGYFFKKEINK